jgi:hypothetical protein
MIEELPAAIQAFINATNAAESETFVAAFTTDAYLNDWGREFHGHEGAPAWNSTDNIGVHSHFDLVSAAPGAEPDSYTVTLRVTGDGYNGTGPMTFHIREGLISRLVIA